MKNKFKRCQYIGCKLKAISLFQKKEYCNLHYNLRKSEEKAKRNTENRERIKK